MKFNHRIIRYILLTIYCGILAVAVSRCGSEPTALESQIQTFLQDNQGISCPERADLVQLINSKSNWAKFYSKSEALDKFIRQVGAGMSGVAQDFTICSGSDSSEQPSAFDFYIENSLSMNGYFKGNREFKDAMLNLLARINGRSDQLGLYFINSEIHEIPEQLTRFFELLEPAYANRFGDGRTSELNKVLDLVAAEWLKDPEKISFVVSDYIYSIRSPNVAEELTDHKYYTTVAMQKLTKQEDFALMILQFQSSFDGRFYDCKNQPHTITPTPDNSEMRPFYVWVFGKSDKLSSFMREYRVTELKGFKHFLLFQRPFQAAPFYSILPQTLRKGTFKAERTGKYFTRLSDLEPPKRDSMVQWAVGVNLGSLSLDTDYMTTPEHYFVEAPDGGEFAVAAVYPATKIETNDMRYKGEATHVLVLTGKNIPKGTQEILIKLRQEVPSWVAESSTQDDSEAANRRNKTFGLLPLVEGVKEAFDLTPQSTYFSLPVQIKR